MRTPARCLVGLTLWHLGLNFASAQQARPLDLIPEHALGGLVLANPSDLRTKGDAFFKEAGLDLGLRPTDALDLCVNFLGVRAGLDFAGPAGIVFLPGPEWNNPQIDALLNNFVVTLSVKDWALMAGNFGLAKDDLADGKIHACKRRPNDFVKVVAGRGSRVYLAAQEKVLRSALDARPLSDLLSPEQRVAFAKDDLFVHLNPKPLEREWKSLRQHLTEEFERWDDPIEKKTAQQFLDTLDSFRFALIGGRLDRGVGLNFLVALDPKSADVRAFLSTLRSEKNTAHLRGLPEGKLVAAQAHAGAGARNGFLARAFVQYLLKNILETNRLTSAADRPTFLGVFNEVWQRLEGSRVGAYFTSDETQRGLFSVVAILDTADAAKFLSELRTLARIADGTLDPAQVEAARQIDLAQLVKDLGSEKYPVRHAAQTKLRLIGEPALPHLEKAVVTGDLEVVQRARRLIAEISRSAAERRKELLTKDLPRYVRPTFAWVSGAEKRLDLPIDIIQIRLTDSDKPAGVHMRQLFGPDWDRMRLAVVGNQVIVLLGSQVELFDAAIHNVKKGLPGVAASKRALHPAGKDAHAAAWFEVSVEALASLVSGQPRRDPGPHVTSFALTIHDSGLQVHLHVPTDEIRILAKDRFQ